MTVGTPHPFAVEAPDAENVWVSTGLDRQVTPEGAISASDRHVWLVITTTDVTVCSTPAFREWLDQNYERDGFSTTEASVYVLPAARPYAAAPVRVMVEHEPGLADHWVRWLSNGVDGRRYLPFARYPRLQE